MPCDYKNYPVNWKTKIRPYILERDGNACKFCKVENGRLIHRNENRVKIVLTIAHLDHDTLNNDYDNLAALCQKCHLSYDKNHHKKNTDKPEIKRNFYRNFFKII